MWTRLDVRKRNDWRVVCEKNESRIEGKQMVKIVYNPKTQADQKSNSLPSKARQTVAVTQLCFSDTQINSLNTCWMECLRIWQHCSQWLRHISIYRSSFLSLKWNVISNSYESIRETWHQSFVFCKCFQHRKLNHSTELKCTSRVCNQKLYFQTKFMFPLNAGKCFVHI